MPYVFLEFGNRDHSTQQYAEHPRLATTKALMLRTPYTPLAPSQHTYPVHKAVVLVVRSTVVGTDCGSTLLP